MTTFTPITGNDQERLREAALRLLDIPRAGYFPPDNDLLFLDPSWKCVPVAENIYAATTYCMGPDQGGWPDRGDLPHIQGYLDPLLWCLRDRGCPEVFISNGWFPDGKQRPNTDETRSCRATPDPQSIGAACEYVVPGGWQRFIMFDATEEWAIVDTWEDEHLLGGTPQFMDQYMAAAGGEDWVRAWYYHFDIWWYTYWKDDGSPDDYMRACYDLAGWPYPVYPPDHRVPWGGDTDWTPMFGDRITSCGPGLTFDEAEARARRTANGHLPRED